MSAQAADTRRIAVVSSSERIHLRLFAEAPAARSAELISALVRCLACHGEVQVHEFGAYWKSPEYFVWKFLLNFIGTVSAACDPRRSPLTRVPAVGGAAWVRDQQGRLWSVPFQAALSRDFVLAGRLKLLKHLVVVFCVTAAPESL